MVTKYQTYVIFDMEDMDVCTNDCITSSSMDYVRISYLTNIGASYRYCTTILLF